MSIKAFSLLKSINKINCQNLLLLNRSSFHLQIQKYISNTKFLFNDNISSSTEKSPRKIRIYTRTGDKGTTSLFTGERLPKNDVIFDALGNTDELNSVLGLSREYCLDLATNNPNLKEICSSIESKLIKIQSNLLDIGSHIATPKTKANQKQLERVSHFDSNLTTELEKWIDSFENELPVLRNFILPSGGKCASCLHLSRSICRRLERSIQPLLKSNDLDYSVQHYINRLSDFLFVCARYVSMKEGKDEVAYKKSI